MFTFFPREKTFPQVGWRSYRVDFPGRVKIGIWNVFAARGVFGDTRNGTTIIFNMCRGQWLRILWTTIIILYETINIGTEPVQYSTCDKNARFQFPMELAAQWPITKDICTEPVWFYFNWNRNILKNVRSRVFVIKTFYLLCDTKRFGCKQMGTILLKAIALIVETGKHNIVINYVLW